MSRPHGLASRKFEKANTLVSTTRSLVLGLSLTFRYSAYESMTGVMFRARLSSPNDAWSASHVPISYANTFSTNRLSAGTTRESTVETPANENTKSKIFLLCIRLAGMSSRCRQLLTFQPISSSVRRSRTLSQLTHRMR